MNSQATIKSLLTLATLTLAFTAVGCDSDDDFSDAELTAAADSNSDSDFRAGECGPGPSATKWRIRNASVQENSGQWSFREMAFCADAECNEPLSGTAIDSGDSASWAPPEYAFDGDTSTLWKTFDADVAGQSWIGLDFGAPTAVHGLYLKTDNVVYSVDNIYVEYYDADADEWVTADYLGDVPAASELNYEVQVRDRFPVQWRVRNATVQANTGQWSFREMDFCSDAACSDVENGGTAIDSGDSAEWAPPAYAFDDDTNTLWKTFDADVAGQSWIGMDYGNQITEIGGVYLETDNVVYSVDTIYVEYFDVIEQAWITSDYLTNVPAASELTYAVANRKRFPTQWRIRNAVPGNTNQWVLREMDFCADTSCAVAENGGTAFDSGMSKSWSLPVNAFDDNTSTLWKTFDSGVAGQSYIGMDYDGEITEISAVYLKTDNVVYSVTDVYVEYYDILADQWVTADTLTGLPAGSNVTRALNPCL